MGLSLKTFGGFALRDEVGAERSLSTRKTRALFAYLAVNADKPQPRERLMSLLWSDRTERQARQSLNHALTLIRRLSNDSLPALLDSDSEQVTLHGAALDSDTARFKALVYDRPAKAVSVYDGPFLDGLAVPDPVFQEWLTVTRSAFHADACEALRRAAENAAGGGDSDGAINEARRLVALDPLREDAHRLLMRLLYSKGDRVGALRQFQECADILARELQVAPDAATQALFDEIRDDTKAIDRAAKSIKSETSSSLLNKPSIVVLRFDRIGDDPVTAHFADGLTEDLTATFAKVPELIVVAPYSTAAYKGMPASVQEIREALGTEYALEGGVQTNGNRLRVTPQLIDLRTGHHIWAERYDREIGDLFVLQDEIVWHILVELQVKLTDGDGARIASRGTRNLEAWLLRVQGYAEGAKRTRQSNIRARSMLEAAHKADPNWARPLAGIAWTYLHDALRGWGPSRDEDIALSFDYAERAVAMDAGEPLGYQILATSQAMLGNHESAIDYAEKAVAVAPNDFRALGTLGRNTLWFGDAESSLQIYEQVTKLCPLLPPYIQCGNALALQMMGMSDCAIEILNALLRRNPEFPDAHIQLAAAYAETGRISAANEAVKTVLRIDPSATASWFLRTQPFRKESHAAWLRRLLLKAGLPS